MMITSTGCHTVHCTVFEPVRSVAPQPGNRYLPAGAISVEVQTGTFAENNRLVFKLTGDTEVLREFVRSLQWSVELAEMHRVAFDEAIDAAVDGDR